MVAKEHKLFLLNPTTHRHTELVEYNHSQTKINIKAIIRQAQNDKQTSSSARLVIILKTVVKFFNNRFYFLFTAKLYFRFSYLTKSAFILPTNKSN